jgi:hypothetical protein
MLLRKILPQQLLKKKKLKNKFVSFRENLKSQVQFI